MPGDSSTPNPSRSPTGGTEQTILIQLVAPTQTLRTERTLHVVMVTSGNEQGRVMPLVPGQRLRIGRSKDCDLAVYDHSCSRFHAEISMDEQHRVFVKDTGSTNGTRINGARLAKDATLEVFDGDSIRLGDATWLRHAVMTEQEAQMQMGIYNRATRDSLTGAYNRHHFEEVLERELSYQKRVGNGLGLLLFDVDHFKQINDSRGHAAGDAVLRDIGQRVLRVIRAEDIFSRIGGEEFAVLCRNDSLEGLQILAERVRVAMAESPVAFENQTIPFTISVGYTLLTGGGGSTAIAFFQLADQALYAAKNTGRNRCVFASTTPNL